MKECEFHNYKTLASTAEAKVDVCSQCKKKVVFRKDRMGRIDNEAYRKEHAKDFLQRWDKNFNRFYGNSACKKT